MNKLALTLGVLALSATAAMAQTIRMGTEGAYPPFNFINDKGQVDGFERELGDELCKRASLTCEWVTTDWDSIIPNLTAGNYDTIIAGMSITEERAKVVSFTQNYTPPAASAYAAASKDADLKGGIVAAQTGTIQAGHVASSGATLVEFATPDETIAAVRNGEADAVFADKEFLVPIVAESGGALVFAGEDVPLGGGVGMGLRQSDTELRGKFDAAIGSMKADGSLNALIVKWFGADALKF
ncbi:transporter substrate-binding domain-containing protein [Gemmobacter sp.]|uniref:transporter substrate-binding domain-containing protein n=1 Tax=Gemmobacter sp. TaxID=1898957 RepID=UPI002AFF7BB3|nr:transporter substrate-binding domain-containing protein [Gemmobacter sp.]